jgi:hypothetical protein
MRSAGIACRRLDQNILPGLMPPAEVHSKLGRKCYFDSVSFMDINSNVPLTLSHAHLIVEETGKPNANKNLNLWSLFCIFIGKSYIYML